MSDEGFLPIIFKNLDELRYRAVRIVVAFSIFFAIFVVFKVEFIKLFGYSIPILYPNVYDNAGAQFFYLIKQHVVPSSTVLIAFKPTDGVVADLYSSMFLALIFSMPVIILEIGKFLSPALKQSEKMFLRSIVVPASLLFIIGSFIGTLYVAPVLFYVFFLFELGIGAETTMSITSFVSFFLAYIITFGLSFETPVIMVGLTRAGLVTSEYWIKHWRYAIVGAMVFGMIFSPGVLGLNMTLMALPIIILYFGGIYFAKRAERKAKQRLESERLSEAL